MTKVQLSDRFVDDLSYVYPDKVLAHIREALGILEKFPEYGSRSIPQSIEQEFGDQVRMVVVAPFDIFYEYDEQLDTVYVGTLVPFRKAR